MKSSARRGGKPPKRSLEEWMALLGSRKHKKRKYHGDPEMKGVERRQNKRNKAIRDELDGGV